MKIEITTTTTTVTKNEVKGSDGSRAKPRGINYKVIQ